MICAQKRCCFVLPAQNYAGISSHNENSILLNNVERDIVYEHRVSYTTFSNKSGIEQSVASTIMSTVVNFALQNLMQKGIGSFLNSGGSDTGSLQSALSHLGGNVSDPSHPLVQQVKDNSGIQDQNQAKQYTQQAIGLLKEHAGNDPQGLSSLLGGFMGNNQQGGIGDLVGGFLGGKPQDPRK